MTNETDTQTVEVWSHTEVYVETTEGESEKILSCELTDDDINNDGTIDYPPSGECNCYPRVENREIRTDGYVRAVPVKELEALADEWTRQRTGNYEVDSAYESAANRLREVLENYE